MAQISIFLICLLGIAVCVSAQHNSTTPTVQDQQPAASSAVASAPVVTYTGPSFWPDSWRSGLSQVFSVGGVIFSGLVIFAGIVWLLGLSGASSRLRLCSFFGNCEKPAISYSTGGNLDPAAQPNAFGDSSQYYNYPGYIQKRSINFLAPMLQKLVSTYEKMEPKNESKKE